MRIFLLYLACQFRKECRTTYTGHILETYLVATVFDHMVHNSHIVFDGMDRRICDRERHLRNHACLLCILDAETQVPVVVQSAERTGDVGSLRFLDLIHEFTHISRNRIHTESIETTLKHMCLDTCRMERCGPFAHCPVGILAEQKVHLLECATIGFDTVEASHIDDCRSDFLQLSDSRYIFPRRLPHVPVYQGELYFTSHMFELL